MAKLLRHDKRTSFHTLSCFSFINDKVYRKINLIFEPPLHVSIDDQYTTLNKLYCKVRLVALGHRVQLACALVMALENFHRVGWVYKSLQSENVIFLPSVDTDVSAGNLRAVIKPELRRARGGAIDLSAPLLFGFEYTRPGEARTNLEEDYSKRRNLYRHPDR